MREQGRTVTVACDSSSTPTSRSSTLSNLDALLGKTSNPEPQVDTVAEDDAAASAAAISVSVTEKVDPEPLFRALESARASNSVEGVKAAMEELASAGAAPLFGSLVSRLRRRTTSISDLTSVGIKKPESIATPEVRDDEGFLTSVLLGATPIVFGSSFLPGEWGFWLPYLTGGAVLVVMGLGSTAPGLLYAVTDNITGRMKGAGESPDSDRALRHEAAHFLVSYVLGTPVMGYSLGIGEEHTDLAELNLGRKMALKLLDEDEVNRLAVIAMAGVAGEGVAFDEVKGGTADLFDLQRLINRSRKGLSSDEQQSLSRWAVKEAATIVKRESAAYERLMTAMKEGRTAAECIRAIESSV